MSARRPWAWALVPLYRAGQALEGWLQARGFPKTKTLLWPVISVGSLSTGGAGKTPVVIALAELLRDAGWHVDVLSRGYGSQVDRSAHTGAQVVLTKDGAADYYGDEPVLIAQRTRVPVWVAAGRYAAGTSAEGLAATGIHLLDDGFQHRELARAWDIVLVTAEDLHDALLPAGNLREPLTALQRADVVVVREDEVEQVAKSIWPLLREGTLMWTVRRTLRWASPTAPAAVATALSAGLRPLAFCAIARPDGFAAALTEAGCAVVDTVIFRDHARYGARQLREIVAFATQLKASGLVTTEKDFVKLSPAAIETLEREVGPLLIAALDATFVDADKVRHTLETRITGVAR